MSAVKIEIIKSEDGDLSIFKNGQPYHDCYFDSYSDLSQETIDKLNEGLK